MVVRTHILNVLTHWPPRGNLWKMCSSECPKMDKFVHILCFVTCFDIFFIGCIYAIAINVTALVIASIFKAYLYCLDLLAFILSRTIFQCFVLVGVSIVSILLLYCVCFFIWSNWKQFGLLCIVLIRVRIGVGYELHLTFNSHYIVHFSMLQNGNLATSKAISDEWSPKSWNIIRSH